MVDILNEKTHEIQPVVLTVHNNRVDATPVVTATIQMMAAVLVQGSPFPPVEVLRDYEAFTPGGGDRLLKMIEKEQDFHHEMARTELKGEQRRNFLGQTYGLIISIVFMAAAVWVAIAGHEIAATTIGTLDIGAVVALFVLGTRPTGRNDADAPDDGEVS